MRYLFLRSMQPPDQRRKVAVRMSCLDICPRLWATEFAAAKYARRSIRSSLEIRTVSSANLRNSSARKTPTRMSYLSTRNQSTKTIASRTCRANEFERPTKTIWLTLMAHTSSTSSSAFKIYRRS